MVMERMGTAMGLALPSGMRAANLPVGILARARTALTRPGSSGNPAQPVNATSGGSSNPSGLISAQPQTLSMSRLQPPALPPEIRRYPRFQRPSGPPYQRLPLPPKADCPVLKSGRLPGVPSHQCPPRGGPIRPRSRLQGRGNPEYLIWSLNLVLGLRPACRPSIPTPTVQPCQNRPPCPADRRRVAPPPVPQPR